MNKDVLRNKVEEALSVLAFGLINGMDLKIKPIFDRIYLEKNDFSRVIKDTKWGFIDAQCNVIVKPKYDYMFDFSKGYAKVEENSKYAHVNTKGELLTKVLFEEADSFK